MLSRHTSPSKQCSSFRRAASAALTLMLLCGTAASAMAQDGVKAGREGTVKVRVPVSYVTPETRTGMVIIAEYESFVVIEAPANAIPKIPGAELLELENLVLLNAKHIDTTLPAVKALQKPRGHFAGKAMHLVQFAGPVQAAWLDQLAKTGVQIITYIPSNAYLVYGDATQIGALQTLAASSPVIQWNGAYEDAYRLDPSAKALMRDPNTANSPTEQFIIQLIKDDDANKATMGVIARIASGPLVNSYDALGYHNVIAPIPPAQLAVLAAQPEVVSIQVYGTPKLLDERQAQIVAGNLSGSVPTGPGYLAWLGTKGFTQAQFTASNFTVDVTDSGIDNGTTAANHFGLYVGGVRPGTSRVVYNRLEGTPNGGSTLQACDGHGNLNSHIIAGYDNSAGFPFADGAGFHYGLGICPFVKVGSSVIFDPSFFTTPNFTTLQSAAYNNNARISSNSWGNTSGNTYNAFSQEYDSLVRDSQPGTSPFPTAGNQEMVIVFANGNSGSGSNTVHAPATAKNLISVGASENVQAFGGADGSGIADSGADNANDIISFSSRGPCSDGRKKPEICAPGTHVSGGAPQVAAPGATGTGLACYNGSGVSGGVGGADYFPPGQQFYTASSGTSHSTPCVAGGAALIRQYFLNLGLAAPSPAMTKALLMNSARYLTGVAANDTLWSNTQGMGEMNLGDLFDRSPANSILRDEVVSEIFTAAGQTRVYSGIIADPTKPFRVTLAWTDAPGATGGAAAKNNLDLTVTVGANTYRGNVFSGASSIVGGVADALDNAESVFLPVGTTGAFTVTVTAANINSDGVPNSGGALDQDYALVIYNNATVPTNNACASATPILVGSSVSGTTVGATNDGAADCGASSTAADVWYSITPTCTGSIRLDTCGSAYDTVLSVHSGCPGTSANEIICNDDHGTGPGGCPNLRDSALVFNAIAGTTYTVRVSGFSGLTGSFNLNTAYVTNGSNACSGAVLVPAGAYVYNNCAATTDGPTEAVCTGFGDPQVNNDLWFKYTSPFSGTVNVNTCASVAPLYDTKLAIYNSVCPVVPNTTITCNDDACNGVQSAVSFSSIVGQTYLIRVGGFSTARGTGTLTISRGCGSADFNGDGNLGTDSDIEAFFACISGTCCPTCGTADFDGDGNLGTDADIEAFFRVLAGGTC